MTTDGVTSEAFVWDNGIFTELGTLSGGNESSRLAINKKGHVAGTSRTEVRGQVKTHAFIWDGQIMIDLDPTLDPSITDVNVTAINKFDQVIAWTSHEGNYDSYNAVRFEDGQVISLIDELSNKGTWKSLKTATSINDSGAIIGIGDPGNGGAHIFMLIPN
jgi:probable HAF family extracellular repeat protein